MKVFGNLTKTLWVGSSCLLLGLAACGGDDSTSAKEPENEAVIPNSDSDSVESSAEEAITSSETSDAPASSASRPTVPMSSSVRSESVSDQEQLAEPSGVVKGTCGPEPNVIKKGEFTTWKFYRETGDLFDAIMSPFVWTFPELEKTISGNGKNKVDMLYPESGVYTAVLNADGTEALCDPLQVQGVPIVVKSCSPDKLSALVGETITWTVDAESEAELIGYQWSSETGSITGNGVSASIVAEPTMHKKKVSAVVTVINADKTNEVHVCDGVDVVDPDQVDITLTSGAQDSTSNLIPAGGTLVAQISPSVSVCTKLICNISGQGVIIAIDGEEKSYDWSAQVDVAGCAPGKKFTLSVSQQALCYVSQ